MHNLYDWQRFKYILANLSFNLTYEITLRIFHECNTRKTVINKEGYCVS